MNLNNFEEQIERKIIDRGFSYYENDYVEDFEQVDKGEFIAIVEGSESYSITINLDKNLEIIDHSCNCPYDWGEYCKHEVAVLFYIKDNEEYKNKPDNTGKIGILKGEIEKYNHKELKKLIIDLSKRNGDFRNELLWHFGYEDEEMY